MEIVNGFQCKNCTDVDYAKKHIDPAHPKDGPYGANADPARADKLHAKRDPAVQFGGALAGLGANVPGAAAPALSAASGSVLNLSV